MHGFNTLVRALFYHTQVNFLAHVYLAHGEPDLIVGQLCGDFIRGRNLEQFAPLVACGIRVHRAVDTYTDRHPLNLQARQLFVAPYRRFAGIIADVAYDHYLAQAWDSYCDIPLPQYAAMVDQALAARLSSLPPDLQRFVPYLQSEKLLQNNTKRAHIDLTLQRLSMRRKSMKTLATAGPVLWENNERLKQLFDEFFPQLVSYTRELQHKLMLDPEAQGAG